LEPGFFFPGFPDAEVAVPLSLSGDERRAERGSNFLRAFGRLAPGATAGRAQAQLAAISEDLRKRYPEDNTKLAAPRVLPLSRELTGGSRATLMLLLGAVGLLLGIACANIAAMTLVRTLRRSREIAVKKALGAGSSRLIGEAMAEMSVLAGLGGAASLAVAATVRPALERLRPQSLPLSQGTGADTGVLLFTAAVALSTAALCALGPALSALRVPPLAGLKEASGAPSRRGRRARGFFVLAQIALSLVLLSGAALLLQSLSRVLSVSPGFDPRHVLVVRLSLPRSAYPSAESARRFFERVDEDLHGVPGILAGGAVSVTPFSGANNRTDFEIIGRPAATPEETPGGQNRWVAGGYFAAMRIPLRRGRFVDASDDGRGTPVAVVDETLARRYWQGANPIGSRLRITATEGSSREVEVVGVVGSVRHTSLEEEPAGTLYEPIAQTPAPNLAFLGSGVSLVVRTAGPPLESALAVRQAIRSVDPDIPAGNVQALDQVLEGVLAARRFSATLVALFAAAAATLAGAGLYGTLSQLVAEGRREIGIRMALGANANAIRRHVVTRGVGLALAGIAAGLLLWIPVSRLAAGLLYAVGPWNPGAILGAAAFLSAVALLATFFPARHATRVDPLAVLRTE
jgi:putative ABC transport system permease protein